MAWAVRREQTAPTETAVREAHRSGGVTRRAVLVALVLLVAVAYFSFFVEMLWKGGWDLWMFSSGCPAITPVFVLFLLAVAMGVPRLGRVALTRQELLVIYAVVLVGAPVVTYEVLAWVLVKSVHYAYFARVNPWWEITFLREVPAWFAPTDAAAVTGFFEGNARVPWGAWGGPLGVWSAAMLALFGASVCLASLLQRSWITDERLTFPIAQVPLMLVRASAQGAGRLAVGRAFWVGALLSFSLHLLNGLAERIPAVPHVPLGPVEVIPWQPVGPLAGLGSVSVVLWPWLVAIAYLVPKDLSFSVWFFWVVRLGLTVAAIAAGAAPQRPEEWWGSSFPAPYYQGAGALLALMGWTLWTARQHLREAGRIALRGGAREREEGEPLPHRWALLGLVVCGGFVVGLLWAAGCRVGFGIVLVVLILAYYAVWARIRAETGLGLLPFPLEINDLVMVPLGSRVLRLRELISLVSMRWAYSPGISTSFEVFTGTTLESYKIAEVAKLDRRRLTAALAAGFAVSLMVGIPLVLTGLYHYGWFGFGFAQSGWLTNTTNYGGGQISGYLSDPRYDHTDVGGLLGVISGAAGVLALGVMRLRFWWWPFHPIGYLAANTWGLHLWSTPFFVGWAAKALVTRYGGLPLYRRTLPLAVGLIVGDLVNSGMWGLLRVVRGGVY